MSSQRKTVLITGATSGIGFAVTKLLLQNDFDVIGVGSKPSSCEQAIQKLNQDTYHANYIFFNANLANLKEVNQLATTITEYLDKSCRGKLYALINNAGGVRGYYIPTEDGYESQFAINHLAGFLLTYRMVKHLQSGMIIFTGSRSHRHMKMHWSDIMYQKHYHPYQAYRQSKLANLMTARELNKRLKEMSIVSYVVDPGLVNTEIGDKSASFLVKLVWNLRKKQGTSPDVPAKTYLYLLKNKHMDGLYFRDSVSVDFNKRVLDDVECLKLFNLSEKLTGISFTDLRP